MKYKNNCYIDKEKKKKYKNNFIWIILKQDSFSNIMKIKKVIWVIDFILIVWCLIVLLFCVNDKLSEFYNKYEVVG